ncbi:hypothetical protein SNEBB_007916 [Seison nebaliae]|nr:hypothetical protein SNEBB_007916 [Seison nebaliae]
MKSQDDSNKTTKTDEATEVQWKDEFLSTYGSLTETHFASLKRLVIDGDGNSLHFDTPEVKNLSISQVFHYFSMIHTYGNENTAVSQLTTPIHMASYYSELCAYLFWYFLDEKKFSDVPFSEEFCEKMKYAHAICTFLIAKIRELVELCDLLKELQNILNKLEDVFTLTDKEDVITFCKECILDQYGLISHSFSKPPRTNVMIKKLYLNDAIEPLQPLREAQPIVDLSQTDKEHEISYASSINSYEQIQNDNLELGDDDLSTQTESDTVTDEEILDYFTLQEIREQISSVQNELITAEPNNIKLMKKMGKKIFKEIVSRRLTTVYSEEEEDGDIKPTSFTESSTNKEND